MATKPKLVLHFDLNETILIEDPVAGLDFDASLNNVMAKAAWIKKNSEQEWVWHDGSPMDPCKRDPCAPKPELKPCFHPLEGCERYFEVLRKDERWPAARFTEKGMPGEIYRDEFENFKQVLRWKHGEEQNHAVFAPHGYSFLLPAFYHTLVELARQGRDFTVVIRTFGTDLPETAKCINSFAMGQHPDFADAFEDDTLKATLEGFQLAESDTWWALQRNDRHDPRSSIGLSYHEGGLGKTGYGPLDSPTEVTTSDVVHDEDEILKKIERGAIGIRDDYFYWRGHKYVPYTGKPLWVTADDLSTHHIFFDDNIHDKADDSIVAVQARPSKGSKFQPVSGEATRSLQDLFLVKAQPVEALRNKDYFLSKVRECEDNVAKLKQEELIDLLFG